MHGRLRSKLSYANVTATLALFIALGGSSYAAIQITGKNVKNSSLTTKDVKNRSLLNRDFKAGQLPAGAQGLPGPQGAQGDKGDMGDKGNDGAPGAEGSAKAFALVSANGSLYAEPLVKNVDRATQAGIGTPTTGSYCLHTTVDPNNVIGTLYSPDTGGEIVTYFYNGIHCNGVADPGYNVTVHTFNSAGTPTDRAFWIAIN